jgi:hypothetical protein
VNDSFGDKKLPAFEKMWAIPPDFCGAKVDFPAGKNEESATVGP